MAFVMSLEIGDFLQLVAKAKEEREKAEAWDVWLVRYPYMTENTFVPFEEFFRQSQRPDVSQRPAEEIISDAEAIRATVARKWNSEET